MLFPSKALIAVSHGILALIIAALIWEIAALAAGNPMLVPDLGPVIGQAIRYFSVESFWTNAWTSAERFLAGYGAAVIVGLPVGLALGRLKALRLALGSLVSGLAAAPLIALAPLTTLWWGPDSASKVSLAFAAAVFPLANEIMTGLVGAEPNMARSIIAGMRIAIVPAAVAVVVAEMVGSVAGLGLLLMNAAGAYDVAGILAVFLVLSLPIIVVVSILRSIEIGLAKVR
jgi:NitT/TauT family transport system permease protein